MTPATANRTSFHAPSSNHAPLVDWLRFITALVVVGTHARVDHWIAWNEWSAADQHPLAGLFLLSVRLGHEGVIVFFVLSGYLVGGKLLQRCQAGTFSVGDFVRDRVTRIFTPFIPCVALTAGCVWITYGGLPAGYGWDVVATLFQLQGVITGQLPGNAPLWSLSYEIWFYALAGGTAALVMHRRSPLGSIQLMLTIAVVSVASVCLLRLGTYYLLCWLIGAIAYVVPRPASSRRAIAAGVLLAVGGTVLSQAAGPYQDHYFAPSYGWQKVGTLILCMGMAVLLPWIDRNSPRLAASRLARAGVPLAGFSYSLYLTHFPLQLVMRNWHDPFTSLTAASLGLFVAKVAICVAAAWLFSIAFERQIPRLRAWWRRRAAFQPAGSHA